jgi:septation ring formation regulator EzrA
MRSMLEPPHDAPRRRCSRWLTWLRLALLGSALLGAPVACQKTYYTVLESVGIEKRELLAKRVENAKESQEEAQEEFRDALERFQAVTGHDGGDLEDKYERLRDAYESSRDQAAEVSERIDQIESVADALFDEWQGELKQYSDPSLRSASAERLARTRSQVRDLLRVMRKAERSLKPVLQKLNDRVLYLKHNLNAAALSGLRAKLPELKDDVDRLVREMQASIAEADQFILSMK